jgi:hypothetical protein
MFSQIKKIFGSGSRTPIGLENCKTVNNWSPQFGKKEVKSCSTSNPRYVVTDSSQERHVVYTDSLSTCLGVLIFEQSGGRAIAGLAHLMPDEEKIAAEMLKKIDSKYGPSRLNVVIAVGDDPSPETFSKTVKILLRASNISKERFNVVYGGTGEPYFLNQMGRGMTSTKIAYNTCNQNNPLNVGES